MKISIIGAGIGGLVAAAGLQQDGHDVTVFERHESSGGLGSGLTLFGNAFSALDLIGLGEPVREISSANIASMRTGQRTASGAWLSTLPREATASLRSVLRPELHALLEQQLRPGSVERGGTARVSPSGAPEVHIDGRTVRSDLVVVADGLRSENRAILGLDPGVRYAGYSAWRGVTGRAIDLGGTAGETWGNGMTFGMVPLPNDRVYWFGTSTVPADTTFTDEHAAAADAFSGWHAPISDCVQATHPSDLMRHDIYDLSADLTTFTRGSTVLLGDAAHAMTPNLGQGAGQSIEDAATLTHLLRDCTTSDLGAALSRYSLLRVPRTREMRKRSRQMGQLAHLSHPVSTALRNTALRLTPGAVLGAASRRVLSWNAPV